MTRETFRLLPAEPAPLELHLVAAAERDSEEPLLRAGRQAADHSSYRAVVVSASGAVIREALLLIPATGEAPAFALDEATAPRSNRDLEDQWRRKVDDLGRLATAGSHLPELLLPDPRGADQPTRTLPPTLLCPVARQLFPAPCPTCLRPLTTCRDDAELAQRGLPLYSTSLTRFLTCPVCTDADRPLVTLAPGDATGGAAACGAAAYNAALAAGIAQLRASDEPPGVAHPPCVRCPQLAACLTPASAAVKPGRGTPAAAPGGPFYRVITDFDSPYAVVGLGATSLHQLVRAIGGHEPSFLWGESDGTIFTGDGSGSDAVECLTLKLVAFSQVVRAARDYQRALQLPHLDLSTEVFAVDFAALDSGLPQLWGFRVRLLGPSGARQRAISDTLSIIEPPSSPQAPFFSPTLREYLLIAPRPGEILVDRLVAEPGHDGAWRLEGRLCDPSGVFPAPTAEDWIVLSWAQDVYSFGFRTAVARLDPRVSRVRATGEVAFTTEPLPFDPATAARLDRLGGVRLANATYKVAPRFGVREDFYSLGMILFSILLVNDRQDLSVVADVVVRDRLASRPGSEAAARPADSLEEAASRAVRSNAEVFGKHNVFYQEVDRAKNRPTASPAAVGLRGAAFAFGLGAAGVDAATADPALAYRHLLHEVDGLVRQLKAILFYRQPVHLEVQSIISELILEERVGWKV